MSRAGHLREQASRARGREAIENRRPRRPVHCGTGRSGAAGAPLLFPSRAHAREAPSPKEQQLPEMTQALGATGSVHALNQTDN
jgi:hypothetical protein